MYESHAIAANVARWTGLGVQLPEDLTDAISLYESLIYAEVSYRAPFDLDGLTPANAEQRIRDHAAAIALADAPAGGQSQLERAKAEAVDAAARRVVAQARAAVPEVIEALTPEFDRHAEAYVEAVNQLPDELDAAALVSAGPGAVAAYVDAQSEAQYLSQISDWVYQLSAISGVLQRDAEVVLRVLQPTTGLELIELDKAAHQQADPTVESLGAVFYTAARLGVEFKIIAPADAKRLRDELTSFSAAEVSFR